MQNDDVSDYIFFVVRFRRRASKTKKAHNWPNSPKSIYVKTIKPII